MSKSSTRKKRKAASHARTRDQRSIDRGVWGTIVLVGGFGLFLWWLFDNESLPYAATGLLMAVLALINFYAWKACYGVRLTDWQRTFAKVPLRFVGYGTRTGKPLDAARGHDNAKMALYTSIAASVVLLLLVSWLILPEFRG